MKDRELKPVPISKRWRLVGVALLLLGGISKISPAQGEVYGVGVLNSCRGGTTLTLRAPTPILDSLNGGEEKSAESLTPTPGTFPPTPLSSLETPTPREMPTPAPEVKLNLAPSMLTLEEASKFLAEGEYMDEIELEEFRGRVFRDEERGITVLTSKRLKENFDTFDRCVEILEYVIEKKLNKEGNFFVFDVTDYGNPIVINLQDDSDYKKRKEWVSLEDKDITRARIFQMEGKAIGFEIVQFYKPNKTQYDPKLLIRWWNGGDRIITADGYQVLAEFTFNPQERRPWQWREIPAYQLINGEFEIIPPEKRIEKIIENYIEVYKLFNPDGTPLELKYITLQDPEKNPAVVVILESSSYPPKAKTHGLNTVTVKAIQEAWDRLSKIEPLLPFLFTRVYGLKIIGGGAEDTFTQGREHYYLATFLPPVGSIEINEKIYPATSANMLTTLIVEARALGNSAEDYFLKERLLPNSNLPENWKDKDYWFRRLDENSGLDKAAFAENILSNYGTNLTYNERRALKDAIDVIRIYYSKQK